MPMNDRADELAGKVEEAAGQATGNEQWVAEGKRRQEAAQEPPAVEKTPEERR
jgi:uncharacterized protein YjbJ (UPF0337 family)